MHLTKGILLEAWNSLQHGFNLLWGNLSHGLPTLIVALLLVVVGSLIAIYLGDLVSSMLKKGGLDKALENVLSPISKLLNTKINSAKLIGDTVEWVLLATVLIATFNLLKLSEVVIFFTQVLSYLPNIFVGVFIMIVGYLLATLVANVITLLTKGEHAYLSNFARTVVFIFAAISALSIVLTPLAIAFGHLLAELHIAKNRADVIFIGLVVLLVLASKNTVTKTIEKLF